MGKLCRFQCRMDVARREEEVRKGGDNGGENGKLCRLQCRMDPVARREEEVRRGGVIMEVRMGSCVDFSVN